MIFDVRGCAVQMFTIRWRLRLWPTRWSLITGYDNRDNRPFVGFAEY